jgi:dihydropteroate synthase
MGILNVNNDSFFASSRASQKDDILEKTTQFIQNKVDIIDVGAVSTRPDVNVITSESEETDRLSFALECIRADFPQLIISCDTFRAKVAKSVVENYGVSIINDISGGSFDREMIRTIAQLKVPYVIMHNAISLEKMHVKSESCDILADLNSYFVDKIKILKQNGIHDIIIDPGFGFAKTITQNYSILKRISYLRMLDCPILVGLSRKSMFYKKFGTSPEDALVATNVAQFYALTQGANILRVHDVREARETVQLFEMLS